MYHWWLEQVILLTDNTNSFRFYPFLINLNQLLQIWPVSASQLDHAHIVSSFALSGFTHDQTTHPPACAACTKWRKSGISNPPSIYTLSYQMSNKLDKKCLKYKVFLKHAQKTGFLLMCYFKFENALSQL